MSMVKASHRGSVSLHRRSARASEAPKRRKTWAQSVGEIYWRRFAAQASRESIGGAQMSENVSPQRRPHETLENVAPERHTGDGFHVGSGELRRAQVSAGELMWAHVSSGGLRWAQVSSCGLR